MFNKFLLSGLFCLFLINLSMAEQKHSPFHNKRVMVLGDSITKVGLYYRYMDYYLQKNFRKIKSTSLALVLGVKQLQVYQRKSIHFHGPVFMKE